MRLATLAVLTLLLVLAPLPALADVSPLSWRDTGYDLAAGYRYTFSIHTSCDVSWWCARAIVDAGPLRIEQSYGTLSIYVNGERLASVGDAWDTTVIVVVNCDGSGTVEVSGYGRVGGFSIDRSYRIMVYTEERHNILLGDAESRVTISRQAMVCEVTNPSLTPVQENPSQQIIYNPLFASIAAALGSGAMIAAVIIIALLGLLLIAWLLGKAGGAKRVIRKAIGAVLVLTVLAASAVSASWSFGNGALYVYDAYYCPEANTVHIRFTWHGSGLYTYLHIAQSTEYGSGTVLAWNIGPGTRDMDIRLRWSVASYPYLHFWMSMAPSEGGPTLGDIDIRSLPRGCPSATTTTAAPRTTSPSNPSTVTATVTATSIATTTATVAPPMDQLIEKLGAVFPQAQSNPTGFLAVALLVALPAALIVVLGRGRRR